MSTDNKDIVYLTEQLLEEMGKFRHQCTQYPNMYKEIDWTKFYEVKYDIANAINEINTVDNDKGTDTGR